MNLIQCRVLKLKMLRLLVSLSCDVPCVNLTVLPSQIDTKLLWEIACFEVSTRKQAHHRLRDTNRQISVRGAAESQRACRRVSACRCAIRATISLVQAVWQFPSRKRMVIQKTRRSPSTALRAAQDAPLSKVDWKETGLFSGWACYVVLKALNPTDTAY